MNSILLPSIVTALILLSGPAFALDAPAASTADAPRVEQPKAKGYNLLFIAIDDLNDWVGCCGGNRQAITPNLDRYAKEHGMVMNKAYCPSTVCCPSRSALLTGHARADQVAAMFSIHSRTLARRLEDFGTSFQALVDEERYAISRQMLQNTDLPVGQVAASLDYADASAFTRAFRRWSGTTPAHWRDEQRRAMQAQRGR